MAQTKLQIFWLKKREKTKEDIVSALKVSKTFMNFAQLAEKTGRDYSTVKDIAEELVQEGKIACKKVNLPSRMYLCYLPEDIESLSEVEKLIDYKAKQAMEVTV